MKANVDIQDSGIRSQLYIISIMLNIQELLSAQSYLSLKLEAMKELILSSNNFHQLKEYTNFLENQIQLKKEQVLNEVPSYARGRGGNNIAQNIKKSLLSVFRKSLPKELFTIFQEQCVIKYELKSQKENILIFFLFLFKFHVEGRINQQLIQKIQLLLREKIQKYIKNSQQKMQIQTAREEFHNKNIREFEKFLNLDLNFRQRKTFDQVANQIKCFYLRKNIEFTKAVQRFSKVVQSDPIFKSFFIDQETQSSLLVKEEQLSESSPSTPTTPNDL